MGDDCTYCGADVTAHDPLYLEDRDGPVGQFCNYACLTEHVEREGLVVGDACEWSPDAEGC
ncbi:eL24 family ribosomal protein [Halosimplex salinum]|uniref:hypothetical protein n=1 Tax=Halosimplex salinum TaxID=1710538 RepID=UPI000F4AB639|nr:hypothetical protein [Halosimplex salinum]